MKEMLQRWSAGIRQTIVFPQTVVVNFVSDLKKKKDLLRLKLFLWSTLETEIDRDPTFHD